MAKNVLVIDNGGRGHALGDCFRNAGYSVFFAPGNGGTRSIGENVPIKADNILALAAFAEKNYISLTVVGPEVPLALGIADVFRDHGLRIFGPSKETAKIESSKVHAKEVMKSAGIPTAEYRAFYNYPRARDYLRLRNAPYVVKASGLASGKGSYVCNTFQEADEALKELLVLNKHGDAGKEVVIEEFLAGKEISIHALCDGERTVTLPSARDYKRLLDNDQGPNTGGMGAICPVPGFGDTEMNLVVSQIILPLTAELKRRGARFTGCIYPGLMINQNRGKVLEFNARFGDPETSVLARLVKNLPEIIEAVVDGKLEYVQPEINLGFSVCVVMVSKGYPHYGYPEVPIFGIEEAEKITGVKVFHSGTRLIDGKLVASEGRIVEVSAVGSTIEAARESAYAAANIVKFKGAHFRKDIGADVL